MAWPKGKPRPAKVKIATADDTKALAEYIDAAAHDLANSITIPPLERFIGGIEEELPPKPTPEPVIATGPYKVTSYARTEPDGTAWQVERKGFPPDQGFSTQEQAETYACAMYG